MPVVGSPPAAGDTEPAELAIVEHQIRLRPPSTRTLLTTIAGSLVVIVGLLLVNILNGPEWEYLYCDGDTYELNKKGDEGWEAVSYLPSRVLMKRRK